MPLPPRRVRAFAPFVALAFTACGAHSGLAQPGVPSAVADASLADAAPDAPADAPVTEIPTPVAAPACELRVLAGPTVVHQDDGGYFVGAALTSRSPELDALVTFVATLDDRFSEALARRLDVPLGGDVTITPGPRASLAPSLAPAFFATSGSMLGGCPFPGDGSTAPSPLLGRWFTYEGIDRAPFAPGAGACLGLANTIGPWLALYRSTNDASHEPLVVALAPNGAPTGRARAAIQLLPGAGLDAALAPFGRGFAWASGADQRGAIELGTLDPEGNETHVVVQGFRGTAVPGVTSVLGDRAVAVAGYDRGSLFVSAFEPDGTVRFRSPSLTFAMDPDAAPAVVEARFGVVVAALAYGDDDPQSGALEVTLLRPDGSVQGEPVRVPIYRSAMLRPESVAAVVRGDQVVLHWTGERSNPLHTSESYAMVLGCR